MPTTKHEANYAVHLPKDALESVRAVADALDLSLTSAVACLIRGACGGGHCERFVIAGIERSERAGLPLRRRPHQNIGTDLWRPVPPTNTTATAQLKDWVRDAGAGREWRLSYRGRPNTQERYRVTGEGWYLTGPGQGAGLLLSGGRHDAIRAAARVIERHGEAILGVVTLPDYNGDQHKEEP